MDATDIMGIPFMKMHGLGNDFVVIDRRKGGAEITPEIARIVGDRRRGIGFDQLAVIESDQQAAARLTFFNPDGSLSAACGNATRCIARHLMDEKGKGALTLRTKRGMLACEDAGNGMTRVNMGAPLTEWREIPLAQDVDTLHLPLHEDPVATSMGNPHCSFFVEDAEAINLASRGPEIERHPLFPERTNVQFASVLGKDHLRMRVWERGTGITPASGSSSCAVAVAAVRRGLTGRNVTLDLDGGRIWVDWREDGVWMTGPTTHVFDGRVRLEGI
ncbi:MAG: diaminopimelate epimerase [Boseongicola sp.]|nr:diaminopimelate epimerase [Boseongicola sp.]